MTVPPRMSMAMASFPGIPWAMLWRILWLLSVDRGGKARHGLFGNKAVYFSAASMIACVHAPTGFFEMTGASPPAPSRVATVRS